MHLAGREEGGGTLSSHLAEQAEQKAWSQRVLERVLQEAALP